MSDLVPTQQSNLAAIGAAGSGANPIAAMAAATGKAMVEAQYAIAFQRPRDYLQCLQALEKECRRPGLAQIAEYRLPRGGKTITGPTVHLANACARAYRNLRVEVVITHDDQYRRGGLVMVLDMDPEANNVRTGAWSIEKTVERRKLRDGEEAIEQRVAADGTHTVYLVAASEADVLQKQNAATSRIERNLILKMIPGDMLESALEWARETNSSSAKADPRAALKKIADGFLGIGVTAKQLAEYLGHGVDQVSGDEIVDLRGIYQAIRSGDTNWLQVMEERKAERTQASTTPDERRGLVEKIVGAKIRHGELIAETLRGAGVDPMTQLERVDIVVLQQVAQAIDGAAQARAKKPEAANGKEG